MDEGSTPFTTKSHVFPVKLGEYELTRLIAKGGMAEVYEGRRQFIHGASNRVAVKLIRPHLLEQQVFVRMFIQEAVLTTFVEHPNVVRVQEFGRVDDTYFLAMEYIDGCQLNELFKILFRNGRRFEPRIAALIAAQACDALQFAHHGATDESGNPLHLIHRDVKPANIFLTRHGVVKLGDFGIARASTAVFDTLTINEIKGTLGYMSPEQIGGEELTARSDVFSLGIVLWEMVTGRHLFTRDSLVAAIKHLSEIDADRLAADMPEGLDSLREVVRLALQRDPEHRLESAEEMARMLRAIAHDGHGPTLSQWLEPLWPEVEARREARARRRSMGLQDTPQSPGRLPTPAVASSDPSAGSAGGEPVVAVAAQDAVTVSRDPPTPTEAPTDAAPSEAHGGRRERVLAAIGVSMVAAGLLIALGVGATFLVARSTLDRDPVGSASIAQPDEPAPSAPVAPVVEPTTGDEPEDDDATEAVADAAEDPPVAVTPSPKPLPRPRPKPRPTPSPATAAPQPAAASAESGTEAPEQVEPPPPPPAPSGTEAEPTEQPPAEQTDGVADAAAAAAAEAEAEAAQAEAARVALVRDRLQSETACADRKAVFATMAFVEKTVIEAGGTTSSIQGSTDGLARDLQRLIAPAQPVPAYPKAMFDLMLERSLRGEDAVRIGAALQAAHHDGTLSGRWQH